MEIFVCLIALITETEQTLINFRWKTNDWKMLVFCYLLPHIEQNDVLSINFGGNSHNSM